MKHAYTFSDWSNRVIPESAPPDELLETLPKPLKYREYRPTWGKGSRSAEKAVATRNRGIREQNLQIFRNQVLPVIVESLDAESLHDAGLLLKDAGLLDRSGFRLYRKDDLSSWLAPGDSRIPQAEAMGATPLTGQAALDFLASC